MDVLDYGKRESIVINFFIDEVVWYVLVALKFVMCFVCDVCL